jgi:hypothetical protein
MILGLDASTSIVGFSFADEKVRDAGFLKISKLETNREKGKFVVTFLQNHPLISKVKCLNLEAALSGFGGGLTSQQTIITLSRWNAVLEYILSEAFSFPIILCNVNTMRKQVLGAARIKGLKPKEYVRLRLSAVVSNLKDFEKLNRKNEWDAHNSDMYDAVVCSLFINK